MIQADCAKILFSETRNWLPVRPDTDGVHRARVALAVLIAGSNQGAGFAAGTEPSSVDQLSPDIVAAWQDCNRATQEAMADNRAASELAGAISFAFIGDRDPRNDPEKAKEFPALRLSVVPKQVGLFGLGGANDRLSLWCFPQQAGMDSGLYTATAKVVIAGVLPLPAPEQRARIVRGVLFSLLLAAFVAVGYCEIEWARGAKQGVRVNLEWWWLGTGALIVLLMTLVGIVTRGKAWAVLVDERNRISLSRFQLVCWTVLLVSGYWTLAMWNIGLEGPFPSMEQDLWYLLGVVNITTVASALVIKTKSNAATPDAQTKPPTTSPASVTELGALDARTSIDGMSWLDLFTGEEVTNRQTVDVSRLQQFVITLLLLLAYASKLATATAGAVGGQWIGEMPEIDTTFVGLLGISHLAYLALKVTPKP